MSVQNISGSEVASGPKKSMSMGTIRGAENVVPIHLQRVSHMPQNERE